MSMKITVDKKVWLNLKKEFVKAELYEQQLGWQPEARYGPSNDNLQMAQVAKWQDDGVASKNIPPRPFMRVGLRDALKSGKADDSFKRIIMAVTSGKGVFKALYQEGDSFRQILRQVMLDWDTPPNADRTVDLKGFNDPLIDTSQLISNVTATVAKKGT